MKPSRMLLTIAQAFAIAHAFTLVEKKLQRNPIPARVAPQKEKSQPAATSCDRTRWYAVALERANIATILFGIYQLIAFVSKSIPPANEIARRLNEPSNTPVSLTTLAALLAPVAACLILYPLVSLRRSKHLPDIAEDFVRLIVDFAFLTAWFFMFYCPYLSLSFILVGFISSWVVGLFQTRRSHNAQSFA